MIVMSATRRIMRDIIHHSYHWGTEFASDPKSDKAENHRIIAKNLSNELIKVIQGDHDNSDKAYRVYLEYQNGTYTAEQAIGIIADIYGFNA